MRLKQTKSIGTAGSQTSSASCPATLFPSIWTAGLALTLVQPATQILVVRVPPPPLHPGAASTAAQWSNYSNLKTDYEGQQQAWETLPELFRDPITRRFANTLGGI
jgi:hypothetical protein